MFAEWLEEMVWWGENEYVPRYMAIGKFVSEGLWPFIINNGYVLRTHVKAFAKNIAKVLYANRGKSCLSSKLHIIDPENTSTEHFWHFHHILSEDKWELFWNEWAVWDDVIDFRGLDRRIDIQHVCWSQLDLDESPQTRVVYELMGEGEETQNIPGKFDEAFD
jgi:hypothetical protein